MNRKKMLLSLTALVFMSGMMAKHSDRRDQLSKESTQATLDPRVKSFLDVLAEKNGPPLYKMSVNQARKTLSGIQAGKVSKLPVDIEERLVPFGSGESIQIAIIRPKGNMDKLPVVIYIHGAGWIMGGQQSHDRLVREIAHGSQAAVVFVNYALAPRRHYPVAHEQSYTAAQWIAKNGKSMNLDTSRMAIAGDSVGGLMATAVAMMAQQRGGPHFIFQLLFYPVTDANFDTPSYRQFATGYWLERKSMKWFWDSYVPNKQIRKNPLVAPLNASLEQLAKLPPALIITNECDVLRDEGEAYARKLMQAGVKTVGVRFLGTIHDSVMLNDLAEVPDTRAAIDLANDMLKNAFCKK